MVIASEIMMADWNLNLDLGKPYSLAFSNSSKTVSLALLSFHNSYLTGLLALRFLSHCLHVFSSQTYVYVSVYLWAYMCLYVNTYVSMPVWIFVYEHVHMLCECVYMYVNICVYGNVWVLLCVKMCVCEMSVKICVCFSL